MNRRKLELICMQHSVTVRIRTSGGQAKYIYLVKWAQGGKTFHVYLCPEQKLKELTESELREKINQLYEKVRQSSQNS